MKFTRVVPMLTVPDIAAAVEFYTGMLGFALLNQMEGWAAVRSGAAEIMLALPNAHIPFDRPNFTGSLYFNLDDVEELWNRLKDQAAVVYPMEDFPYGMREFAIRDNNGYLLQFGQELPR